MADSTLAVPELAAVEVKGVTREAFLIRGTLAAVAVGGLGAVGPFLSDAFAQSPSGDLAILNYALTLEYLESDFYNVKGKTVGLTGAAKTLAGLLGSHEAAHVSGLAAAIKAAGGTPATKPKFSFPVTNQATFLALASVLENTGVSAYNGQGPKLQNKQYLATAGSIVQIEARHAAAINYMIGKSPTPDGGFDKPLEMAAVLKAVKP
ncbi:MAG TPA: ferritin-like domain-containing protein, partial [Solirubrobacteraceae bacterium]|nr:ferritin-like domain-containing protein [Solirubrobacteraceae bacterium]